jgi:uncharacterized cupredoxin-like copper-binding protein
MKRHVWVILGILGILVMTMVLAACGPSDDTDDDAATTTDGAAGTAATATAPQTITVTAEDIRFNPMEIRVQAGTPMRLQLMNAGALEHDFTAPGLNSTDEMVGPSAEHQDGGSHTMGAMEPGTVHLATPGEEAAMVEFTPRAGTISFYCSVPGHKEAGMTGTIIVE